MGTKQIAGMTFSRVAKRTKCKCMEETLCLEDTQTVYLHKVSNEKPVESDFRTYWERGKKPNDLNDCLAVCLHKGLSFYPSPLADNVVVHWQQTHRFSPQWKTYICRIKIKPLAGLIRHTPSRAQYPGAEHHHTFFKCDSFTVDRLDLTTASLLSEG